MRNHKSIVYIHHDRHTEDHIEVYPYSQKNWEVAKEKCRQDWGDPSSHGCCECDTDDYFKWSWDGSGSYHSSVQVIDRFRTPKLKKLYK